VRPDGFEPPTPWFEGAYSEVTAVKIKGLRFNVRALDNLDPFSGPCIGVVVKIYTEHVELIIPVHGRQELQSIVDIHSSRTCTGV
jgi:hypothetical protein